MLCSSTLTSETSPSVAACWRATLYQGIARASSPATRQALATTSAARARAAWLSAGAMRRASIVWATVASTSLALKSVIASQAAHSACSSASPAEAARS